MDLDEIKKELCPGLAWVDNVTLRYAKMNGLNGICYFQTQHNQHIATIQINDMLADMPISCKATVWHELCHAEPWIVEGHVDGHNCAWLNRLFRKPWLAIWNLTIEKLLTVRL